VIGATRHFESPHHPRHAEHDDALRVGRVE
jgi:hypothetical protein